MLTNPTLDKLQRLRLNGMHDAYREQLESSRYDALGFDERFALLLDRQEAEQDTRRLQAHLKKAKLRQSACVEDIDYRKSRGLNKTLVQALAECNWLRSHENCIITGPTGAGKSYLACAFGNQACRRGFTVHYFRAPRFFQELAVARGTGSYDRVLRGLLRTDLIIIDDWGTALLADEERRDLFEVIEDRYDRGSTLISAQVPIEHWHETIGDPTLADAILDRLIHNAHTITLKGESMRKRTDT
jgi:DNA replication protein DnaC